MNFIFRILYNALASAMEYPIVVLLLSLLLAVALVSNVHTAKLICDFSNGTTTNSFDATAENTICSLRSSVDYGVEKGELKYL